MYVLDAVQISVAAEYLALIPKFVALTPFIVAGAVPEKVTAVAAPVHRKSMRSPADRPSEEFMVIDTVPVVVEITSNKDLSLDVGVSVAPVIVLID